MTAAPLAPPGYKRSNADYDFIQPDLPDRDRDQTVHNIHHGNRMHTTHPPPQPLRPADPVRSISSASVLDKGDMSDNKDDLTSKGRKRKRLAKACSACHKNKRRCDGFAPCSNCEFSARPCVYLNAQGEQIPPPRTRDSSVVPKRGGADDPANPTQSSHGQNANQSQGQGPSSPGAAHRDEEWAREDRDRLAREERMRDERVRNDERDERRALFDAVERDPSLSTELIEIFFSRTPPHGAMFHGPTFRYRYYLNIVSPFLLDAIYLLASRLCEHPSFLAAVPATTPVYLRGEPFAERCRAAVDRVVEIRSRWSEDERRLDIGTWEETEFVQTCNLLSLYYNCTRQPRLGLYYLDVALSVLRPGITGTLPPPSQRLGLSVAEYFTLAEVRNRTFWMCMVGDMCSAANGRPRRVLDHEIAGVPLPGTENHWARWGGLGVGGSDPGRRDALSPGTGNWLADEGQVGELGHIVRILAVFANIMSIANNGGAGSHEARHLPATHYEHALKAWALELPRHMRFDEINLSVAMSRVHSPVPETCFSGWAFAYMHAVAECGMFYLQVAPNKPGSYAIGRQSQAVDNLAVILDSLGTKGREGAMMFFPVTVVTAWNEHLRSAASPPAPHTAIDDHLNTWWVEMRREWGWEKRDVLDRGLFPFPDPNRAGVPASSNMSGSDHPLSHRLSSGPSHPASQFNSLAPPPSNSHYREWYSHPYRHTPPPPSNPTSISPPRMFVPPHPLAAPPSSLGLFSFSSPEKQRGPALVHPGAADIPPLSASSSGSRHILAPLRPRAASGSASNHSVHSEQEMDWDRRVEGERETLPPISYLDERERERGRELEREREREVERERENERERLYTRHEIKEERGLERDDIDVDLEAEHDERDRDRDLGLDRHDAHDTRQVPRPLHPPSSHRGSEGLSGNGNGNGHGNGHGHGYEPEDDGEVGVTETTTVAGPEGTRTSPVAVPSVPRVTWATAPRERERERDVPVGIEALLSAAEVRRREGVEAV